jgi:3-phenylpropionate/cinnamic acid dioxygenase small subunit
MGESSLQHEVEQFLFYEAELIDHRRLDEWAELFVEGAVYAVPNAAEDGDPRNEGFIIHEDRRGIAERVRRLQHPAALTQVPPPRTRHMIANVVARRADDGDLLVTSNQVVYFARQGRETQYPGSWEHVLTRAGDGWRIKRKKIFLLANDQWMSQLPVL